MRRLLALLLLAFAALPAFAQTAPAPALPRVALETSAGRIVIEVDTVNAPVTSANFLRYVEARRLDGVAFYRIVKLESDYGIIQFGLGGDSKKAFPPIRHEPTTQTGIKHTSGAISMARNAPGTARAEFTISIGNQWSLDADPSKPGDNLGYPAFGHVIEGMEVVTGILNAPISPTKSLNGAYKGETPEVAVRIVSARRLP